MFSDSHYKNISCIKELKPSPKDKWISFDIQDFLNLRGQIIEIENISLKCNDINVCSPFIINWNDREIVLKEVELCDPIPVPGKPKQISRCHGCTLCNWDRNKYITPTLQNNIYQFFASDMQMAYMNFKNYITENDSLTDCCKECDIHTYYADSKQKTGSIECITFSTTILQHKKKNRDPLLHFIEEILNCDSMCSLFKHFTEPYMKTLERYGVEFVTQQENENIFPPIQIQKECDSDFSSDEDETILEWCFILPIDAIKKMLLFCQTLENQNNVYYIPEKETNPLTCFIYTPRTEHSLTYILDIQLLIGKLSTENNFEPSDLTSLNTEPATLALMYDLSIEKDKESIGKYLEKYRGITSVRTGKRLIFC